MLECSRRWFHQSTQAIVAISTSVMLFNGPVTNGPGLMHSFLNSPMIEPSRVLCRFLVMKDGEMPKKYDPEVKARAVRMVREHVKDYGSVTAASVAVGAQLGIARESLRRWVAQAEVDDGARPGVTTAESEEIRRLKAENKRLLDANAILRARRGAQVCTARWPWGAPSSS